MACRLKHRRQEDGVSAGPLRLHELGQAMRRGRDQPTRAETTPAAPDPEPKRTLPRPVGQMPTGSQTCRKPGVARHHQPEPSLPA